MWLGILCVFIGVILLVLGIHVYIERKVKITKNNNRQEDIEKSDKETENIYNKLEKELKGYVPTLFRYVHIKTDNTPKYLASIDKYQIIEEKYNYIREENIFEYTLFLKNPGILIGKGGRNINYITDKMNEKNVGSCTIKIIIKEV